MLNQMTPADRAWVAGIVEGEGCIGIYGGGREVGVIVAMTDHDVIRRLHEVTGVGRVTQKHSAKDDAPGSRLKTAWYWRVYKREDARDLLRALLPLMGLRRQHKTMQALQAIEKLGPAKRNQFA